MVNLLSGMPRTNGDFSTFPKVDDISATLKAFESKRQHWRFKIAVGGRRH